MQIQRPESERVDRRTFIKTSAVGGAVLLAGCSSGEDGGDPDDDGTEESDDDGTQPEEGREIHILTDYASDRWQTRWEDILIPEFEAETNHEVTIEYSGTAQERRNRLNTLFQAGNTPEIANGLITDLGQYAAEGETIGTGPILEDIQAVLGEINPNALEQITIDEPKLVPHGTYCVGVFNYRKDIYDELGLSVPQSWSELLSNTEAIADSDYQLDAYGISAVKGGGKSNVEFMTFLKAAGGGIFQWESDAEERLALNFQEEHVVDALEFMKTLSEYSTDPSSIDWGPTLQAWPQGRMAQTISLNGWLAGQAHTSGATDIANATEVAFFPKKEADMNVIDRGYLVAHSLVPFDTEAGDAGAEFLRFMYGTRDRAAGNYATEPTRMIPPYSDLIQSDEYRNLEIFQENQHLLEINQKILNEIMPSFGDQRRLLTHPIAATIGSRRIQINADLVNMVLVQDEDPQSAYEWAVGEYEDAIAEANEDAGV